MEEPLGDPFEGEESARIYVRCHVSGGRAFKPLLVWKRDGSRWIPKPFDTLNDQALITRHLELITQVGAAVTHTKDGRTGTLTGRGGWLQVEVRWDAGAVELVKDGLVRVGE